MKKLILSLFVIFLITTTSCKKNKDRTGGPNIQDSKSVLSRTSQQLQVDIADFTKSEGAAALLTLSNTFFGEEDLPEPEAIRTVSRTQLKSIAKGKTKSFKKTFVPRKNSGNDSDPFDFYANKGVYNWNKETETFEKDGDSEFLVMNYPSPETNETNNATLTFYGIEEKKATIDGEEQSLPTGIRADLYIDDVKYVEVEFSADFDSQGEINKVEYRLYLKPFTNTFTYNNSSNNHSLNLSVAKDGESTIFSIGGSAYLSTSDLMLDKLVGHVMYREVKADVAFDAKGFENETSGDIVYKTNKYYSANLRRTSNNTIIGEIVWREGQRDGETIAEAYILFPDGSSEKLSTYLQPVLDDLEGFFSEEDTDNLRKKTRLRKTK